jgi:hypothetical protein
MEKEQGAICLSGFLGISSMNLVLVYDLPLFASRETSRLFYLKQGIRLNINVIVYKSVICLQPWNAEIPSFDVRKNS